MAAPERLPGDVRHGQMHFVFNQLAAGGDGIQARRQRAQGGDQLMRIPRGRVQTQQVDELMAGKQLRQLLALFAGEQPVQLRVAGSGGEAREQRSAHARQFATCSQPFVQAQVFSLVGDLRCAIELQVFEDLVDQGGVVGWPDTQRIAGCVVESGACQ